MVYCVFVGTTLLDLPRYGQLLQCLKDILAVNYDNREAISVKAVGEEMFEITGKGFSRVSALAFAVFHSHVELDNRVWEIDGNPKLEEEVNMFKQLLGTQNL